jgi:hypothetical protein
MVRLSAVARVNRRDVGVTRMRLAASSMVDVRIEAVGVPVGQSGQSGQSGQTARTSQSGRTD